MAKVLSLSKARKARDRAARAAEADRNAARHGRTRAERAREALERRRGELNHEGHLREVPAQQDPQTPGDPVADVPADGEPTT